jgi:undecaprenyl-diphosphatase
MSYGLVRRAASSVFLFMNYPIFYFLYNLGLHSIFVSKVAFVLAQYSNPFGFVLALIVLIGIFFTHKDWKDKKYIEWVREMIVIGASVVSAYLVTFILKTLIHASRPFVLLSNIHPLVAETPYDSFPSGHATAFFALAMAIYLYDKKWGTVFFIIAILVSLSRVIAGVHFPIDVVVGAVIGILISYIAHGIFSKISKRSQA